MLIQNLEMVKNGKRNHGVDEEGTCGFLTHHQTNNPRFVRGLGLPQGSRQEADRALEKSE